MTRNVLHLATMLLAFLLLTWPLDAETSKAPAISAEAPMAAPIVHWPSFRGPDARGVAADAPSSWNGETGVGIRWKTAIPGLGHSSPVIWGDRIFITTAVAEDLEAVDLKVGLYGDGRPAGDAGPQSWRLYCLDKTSGEVLWQRTAHQGTPKIKRHPKSSHANSTPAVDAERVAAFFGSEGLHVYDHDGKLLWTKDFGVLHSGSFMTPVAQWGFGSSAIFHDGKLIVQADVLKDGFLVVLEAKTGREIWRVAREEFPTWSTPTVWPGAGDGTSSQIVVNGFKHMGGYDLATGEALWWLSGGGDVPVPTPVVAHDMVYLTNAHGAKSPVYAIRPQKARGDISLEDDATSNAHIAWSIPRGGAYMQTPLAYGDELYVCRDNGVLSVFDAVTGERHYQERLDAGTGFTSSPVAAGGQVYFTSEQGEVHVLRAGKTFERLSVNPMGEIVMSTPAISEGVLYMRTRHHMVAIDGETDGPEESSAQAP